MPTKTLDDSAKQNVKTKKSNSNKKYNKPKSSAKNQALKITLIYCAVGCLWILISDKVVEIFVQNPRAAMVVSTAKGWLYVLVTALLSFAFVYASFKKLIAAKDELEKANLELSYLSYHDKLTGIYNRRYYEDEIKRLDIKENLPISVILTDINGLKLVNDIYGHFEGDSLIKKSAENIKNACRQTDIIARWGGDEIIVLLPNTTYNEVKDICSNINMSLYKENMLLASLSIGFATKQNADEEITKVIKLAEDFMYKRKLLQSKSLRSSIVSSIVSTLQERSIETKDHSDRMKKLSRETGIAMRISETMLDDLELLSLLHDIGKIAIKDSIINKPSKLTDEEWIEMKRHAEIGYHITQTTTEFQHLSEYILSHHENWDGTGYPHKLKGEEIPLLSRIISVVDAYDAMTNDRPYRKALSNESAIDELLSNSGKQFDPQVVNVFVNAVIKR